MVLIFLYKYEAKQTIKLNNNNLTTNQEILVFQNRDIYLQKKEYCQN